MQAGKDTRNTRTLTGYAWQSEWDSYELLLGNYSDGKVDGTLRPYECKVMRSI